jgi:transcriptional regulator with XRE-family HTH domain
MGTREEIGRRVRSAREGMGLSQTELGRKMTRQRTYAAISDIERGKSALAADELLELARILEKDVSYFYGTQPAASVAGAVFRRGERGMSMTGQQETNAKIEQFKQMARERARQQEEEKR